MADAQLLQVGDEGNGILKAKVPIKLEPVSRCGDAYCRAS